MKPPKFRVGDRITCIFRKKSGRITHVLDDHSETIEGNWIFGKRRVLVRQRHYVMEFDGFLYPDHILLVDAKYVLADSK